MFFRWIGSWGSFDFCTAFTKGCEGCIKTSSVKCFALLREDFLDEVEKAEDEEGRKDTGGGEDEEEQERDEEEEVGRKRSREGKARGEEREGLTVEKKKKA